MESPQSTSGSDWLDALPTQRCLITRAVWPLRVHQPCTDILPRTLAWLDGGVPQDFIDRAEARIANSGVTR